MATTTIQVSEELADELAERKRRGDTYEHVIRRLLEAERRREEWSAKMDATREAAPEVDLPERQGAGEADGERIRCEHCGNVWTTKSESERPTCSQCTRKTDRLPVEP